MRERDSRYDLRTPEDLDAGGRSRRTRTGHDWNLELHPSAKRPGKRTRDCCRMHCNRRSQPSTVGFRQRVKRPRLWGVFGLCQVRTDSASLRFFRQRIASFLSPRTDSASLRLVAEAIAVRDTRALVRSRSSVACVRAGDYAGNLTNWRENTRCAARPPASGATRPRRSRPAVQAGTATSRRRRCRLRPTFKGVMRCRMESPSDEAMRCRFAVTELENAELLRR
jgi:hypothetical protein